MCGGSQMNIKTPIIAITVIYDLTPSTSTATFFKAHLSRNPSQANKTKLSFPITKLTSILSLGLAAFCAVAMAAEHGDNGAQPAAAALLDERGICTRDKCIHAPLFKPTLAKIFCQLSTALPPPPHALPTMGEVGWIRCQ